MNFEPIRICYVIASLNTDRAGTEGHLLRLIRGLDRDRFSPQLVVLQASAFARQLDDPQVPRQILGFRSYRRPVDWLCIRQLSRYLRQSDCQIVETHFPDAHLLAGVAAWWAGAPVVLSCRRDLVRAYGRKELLLCRLANRYSTRWLANSAAVAEASAAREGIDRKRFEIIYNGVDARRFDPPSTGLSSVELYRAERPTVVMTANLTRWKSIPVFLHAAARVAEQRPDVAFVVLGSGPEEQPLKQLAAELELSHRVSWPGSVAAVAPYLWQATVGCLCSPAEGFSNAVLEYMAAGLPVVATRVGGNAEAIVDGETGYLVPPEDSVALAARIVELLNDPPRAAKMGAAGRQRVEQHFSFDVQMLAYEQLYQRLVAEHAPGTAHRPLQKVGS